MKARKSILGALALLFTVAGSAMAQTTPTVSRISPHETISAHIGSPRGPLMIVVYGRPSSKDPKTSAIRKIWGGLIPWGKVWRTGSDEATLMILAAPIVMGDTTIPAGAYTLFTVPNEDGTAKLIINKKIGQWGIPYNEAAEKDNELARIDLKKDAAPEKQVDQFTMSIDADAATGGGILKMVWENTAFAMPFTLKK
jgi:hypothetical protein